MAVADEPLGPPIPERLRPLVRSVAHRLATGAAACGGAVTHGPNPQAAEAVAVSIVRRATLRAGDDRTTALIEDAVDELEAQFQALAGKVGTGLVGERADAAIVSAWIYVEASDSGRREVELQEVIGRIEERCFLAPVEPAWATAHGLLMRGKVAGGRRELANATRAVLSERAERALEREWVDELAGIAADLVICSWRSPLAPRDAQQLRQATCTAAWTLVVRRFLAETPRAELARLASRSLMTRSGKPDEDEIDNIEGHLTELAVLVDLSDATTIARIARSAPHFARRTSTLDPAWNPNARREHADANWAERDEAMADREMSPTDGGSESEDAEDDVPAEGRFGVLVADGSFDAEDRAHVADRLLEIHGLLRSSVARARERLRVSGAPSAHAADVLDRVGRIGEYTHETIHELRLRHAGDAPRPMSEQDRRAVELTVNRAYDRLRTIVADDGFVLLEDPTPETNEDTAAVLHDAVRLVLPHSLADPFEGFAERGAADGLSELGLTAAHVEAMRRELLGAPLLEIVHAFAAVVARIDGGAVIDARATAQLRRTRRATRALVASRQPVRFMFEPMMEPATRLPSGLRGLGLKAGRVIAVAVNDGLPIERKSEELTLAHVIPRLPEPLNKTHKGRWWYIPSKGVGC